MVEIALLFYGSIDCYDASGISGDGSSNGLVVQFVALMTLVSGSADGSGVSDDSVNDNGSCGSSVSVDRGFLVVQLMALVILVVFYFFLWCIASWGIRNPPTKS